MTTAGFARFTSSSASELDLPFEGASYDRPRLLKRLAEVRRQLERLREFVLGGDTSAKVRQWLTEMEADEGQLTEASKAAEETSRRHPLVVHPGLVKRYLDQLPGLLAKGGLRTRQVLQGDIERIVIHPVHQVGTVKPFARAEISTTAKGLLARVAFVVAGAGFEAATFGVMRGKPATAAAEKDQATSTIAMVYGRIQFEAFRM